MEKMVSAIVLISLLSLGGSLVGAEAAVTPGSVVTVTNAGNAQPSGNGYAASSNAHTSKWGTGNYQPITVMVNGVKVAQGDPPSPM